MATTNEGRDSNGKFAPGNRGGPGRPRRVVEASYLRELRDRVPVAEWGEIIDKARADALAGDAVARAFLAKYLMGEAPSLRTLAAMEDAAGSVDEAVERTIAGNRMLTRLAIEEGAY